MRNKLRTICITLGILTAALCLTSCWNSVSNNADLSEQPEITTVLFKGKINPDSSLPKDLLISKSDNSRAAGPASLDMIVFEYYVKATSSEGAVLTAEVTEDPATHQITFEMPLNFGVWTIETVIRNISTQEVILFDSFTTELLRSSPTFSHAFYLKPVTGGQGSVALEISVPAAIEKMHIEVQSKPDGATFANEDIIPASNKININRTELASGVYTVILSFYDDKSVVYSSVQTINVLRGLQTTKWLSTGSSTLISNDGRFVISSAIIQAWRTQRTHYYVDYTNGDDFNSGSPLDPFKSLSKTVAIINDVYGTTAKEITISILNGTNENVSDSIRLNQNKTITVQSEDDKTTTLLRAHTGAFIEIPSSSELIISKFVIDGKSIEGAENIGIKNQGTLRMTGCTVKNNKNTASDLGAGIYNASSASLHLTNVEITGNFCDDYGAGILNNGTAELENITISGNRSTDDGAGIYSSTGSTLNINHATLTGNTCSNRGGGIYNAGTAVITNLTLSSSEGLNGAGIFNQGTLTLTTAEITGNTEADKGAGIFNSQTATLTSVTISSNTCSSMGAGIYNEGTLTLNNTNITGNTSNNKGGGIYTCGTLNLNSGEITGNTCAVQGAGICIGNDVVAINITGGVVKNNTLTSGSTKANLYLPEGKKLNITDSLKDGSEFWLTFGWTPKTITTSDNTVFTHGYGPTNNSGSPSNFFKSDVQYPIIPTSPNPGVIEATIALSGKNFVNVYECYKLNFACNIDKFKQGDLDESKRTVIITPTLLLNNTAYTDTENPITWKLTLFYRGSPIKTSNSNTLVIDSSYTGRYDLHVYAEYLGLRKDAEFVITGYNNIISITGETALTDLQNEFNSITNGTPITKDTCINLMTDLDFSTSDYYPISAKVDQNRIVNTNTDFEGVFDGNGHTITLGKVVSEDFVAICFRNKGVIQNVIIKETEDIYITEGASDSAEALDPTKNKFHSFGGLCHFNDGVIRNCWNTIDIKQSRHFSSVGGLCCANNGLIENCINTGNLYDFKWSKGPWRGVYGEAGGITGCNSDGGIIRNCVNYGEIQMNTYFDSEGIGINGLPGAICGAQLTSRNNAKVEYCYWLENCVKNEHSQNLANSSTPSKNWLICEPDDYSRSEIQAGYFSYNGYFPSKTSGTLNASPAINGQTQTLQYGSSLLDALNQYVTEKDPNHSYLKEWEATSLYAAVLKQQQ